MPLTKEQAQVGVKVTLPISDSTGYNGYHAFREEIETKQYPLPYLIIKSGEEYSNRSESDCLEVGFDPSFQGEQLLENLFGLEDVDLYHDPEQANPTPYSLPEEGFEGNTEDPINPTHYKGKEVFNQMVDLFGVEEVKVFCRLNAYKYLSRAGKKEGNPIDQDVAKALWYLKEYDNLNSLPNGQ